MVQICEKSIWKQCVCCVYIGASGDYRGCVASPGDYSGTSPDISFWNVLQYGSHRLTLGGLGRCVKVGGGIVAPIKILHAGRFCPGLQSRYRTETSSIWDYFWQNKHRNLWNRHFLHRIMQWHDLLSLSVFWLCDCGSLQCECSWTFQREELL